jgi:hypothetical protein
MVTFSSNIKSIVKSIETAQVDLQKAKMDGMKQITQAAFKQVEDKYIIKGNFAHPSKSGKTLQYDKPPGANIGRKQTLFNKKTKFRKVITVMLWVSGKVVSRSGTYQNMVNELSKLDYREGNNQVGDVRVNISNDGIKIYADDKSEFFKLETFKQAGRTKVMPLTKACRSVVNLWKSVRVKLGK